MRTDAWTYGASMPTPRGSHASAVLDGRIYLHGGNIPDQFSNPGNTTVSWLPGVFFPFVKD